MNPNKKMKIPKVTQQRDELIDILQHEDDEPDNTTLEWIYERVIATNNVKVKFHQEFTPVAKHDIFTPINNNTRSRS